MFRRRSAHLLILLVIMPLALLAWLGTYLYRDAERRTETTRSTILAERVHVSDYHLVRDISEAVARLDHLDWNQERPPSSPWITSTYRKNDSSTEFTSKHSELLQALEPLQHQTLETGGNDSQLFRPLTCTLPTGWTLFLHQPLFPNRTHEGNLRPTSQSGLIWSHRPKQEQAIYWQRDSSGHWALAELDLPKLKNALFEHLPPPGMPSLPGMMLITDANKRIIHRWGLMDSLRDTKPDTIMPLSAPLSHWTVSYLTAPQEFPHALLFPIVLGVTSGSVLVLALAWIFFRESNRELRVAKQRVSFVNQISHELKTPLTNIQLYTEMARSRIQAAQDTVADRQLGVVESETARLHRLIQNVLNFSRHREDKAPLNLKTIDLTTQLHDIVEYWRPLLEKRGFVIETDLPDGLHALADSDALQQILGNLLSNVEKYASTGKWVRITATEEAGQTIAVCVDDRGVGIPPGKHETIFEAFERVRSDTSEGVSGTGIGLTISRELAQNQGGSLSADPAHTTGARFILNLRQP